MTKFICLQCQVEVPYTSPCILETSCGIPTKCPFQYCPTPFWEVLDIIEE